ncbi:MAG: ATP synthase F0 subunit B [Syntrophorhabdales bacterium]|jgi:F-type H+-transporting ATPase subunit b
MIDLNYTLIIQFSQFLILLILLNFLLFRPMLNALKKRHTTIQSLAERAEDTGKEAEGLTRTYEENLKEKRLPVMEQREKALKEAHAVSMKVIEEARRDLAEELTKVKDTVKSEGESAFKALLGESDRFAVEIAQKIMKRGI